MPLKIELRNDGWYEAGKDDRESWPIAYEIFLEKQKLKAGLEKVQGENLDDVRNALGNINANRELSEFRRPPYLQRNLVLINTAGLPGEAYLGRVVEETYDMTDPETKEFISELKDTIKQLGPRRHPYKDWND